MGRPLVADGLVGETLTKINQYPQIPQISEENDELKINSNLLKKWLVQGVQGGGGREEEVSLFSNIRVVFDQDQASDTDEGRQERLFLLSKIGRLIWVSLNHIIILNFSIPTFSTIQLNGVPHMNSLRLNHGTQLITESISIPKNVIVNLFRQSYKFTGTHDFSFAPFRDKFEQISKLNKTSFVVLHNFDFKDQLPKMALIYSEIKGMVGNIYIFIGAPHNLYVHLVLPTTQTMRTNVLSTLHSDPDDGSTPSSIIYENEIFASALENIDKDGVLINNRLNVTKGSLDFYLENGGVTVEQTCVAERRGTTGTLVENGRGIDYLFSSCPPGMFLGEDRTFYIHILSDHEISHVNVFKTDTDHKTELAKNLVLKRNEYAMFPKHNSWGPFFQMKKFHYHFSLSRSLLLLLSNEQDEDQLGKLSNHFIILEFVKDGEQISLPCEKGSFLNIPILSTSEQLKYVEINNVTIENVPSDSSIGLSNSTPYGYAIKRLGADEETKGKLSIANATECETTLSNLTIELELTKKQFNFSFLDYRANLKFGVDAFACIGQRRNDGFIYGYQYVEDLIEAAKVKEDTFKFLPDYTLFKSHYNQQYQDEQVVEGWYNWFLTPIVFVMILFSLFILLLALTIK